MNDYLLKEEIIIEGIRGVLFESLLVEGQKGCDSFMWKTPVDIEPVFEPYELNDFLRKEEKIQERKAVREIPYKKKHFRLWVPITLEIDWKVWEEVLKELTVIRNKVSFEIFGNRERISIYLALGASDVAPVRNAMKAKFPCIEFEELRKNPLNIFKDIQDTAQLTFQFFDYFPTAPYFRNLTSYETMTFSPLSSLYSALSSFSPPEAGLYQVIFKPCRKGNNWHRNVMNLVEAEYKASKYGSLNVEDWFSPALSHEVLHQAEKKAHPEKPFFAVCARIGLLCDRAKMEERERSMELALANFRYGGVPLNTLRKEDCASVLENEKNVARLLYERLTHRQGMLLNSAELAGLCHLPSKEVLENKECAVDRLTQIRISHACYSGIVLGTNEYAGKKEIVFQPKEIRSRHTAVLGKIGMGKSVLLENMIMQDVEAGNGVAVIDPHGELVEKILVLIPERRIQDVILFDPCDDEYVICFNPLDIPDANEAGRVADDFVVCFRSIFTSWGERMENIFRHCFYALLKAREVSLSNLRTILSKDREGEMLRRRIIPVLENEEAVRFWTEDFPAYHPSALDPVLNKLGKFLLNDRIARILRQKKNKLDFREIMDNRKILLMHLPAGIIGSDSTNLIGSLSLALFYHAAMSRAIIAPEERVPFFLYVDEFHRFPTKSTEDLLRETRKYNLGMIMAFQQREQISESVRIALGNVGTLIAFGLSLDDAQRIFKEFAGQVEVERLLKSAVGEACAMIGNSLTTLTTFPPKQINSDGFTRKIQSLTREKYCELKSTGEITPKSGEVPATSKMAKSSREDEEVYDEF